MHERPSADTPGCGCQGAWCASPPGNIAGKLVGHIWHVLWYNVVVLLLQITQIAHRLTPDVHADLKEYFE